MLLFHDELHADSIMGLEKNLKNEKYQSFLRFIEYEIIRIAFFFFLKFQSIDIYQIFQIHFSELLFSLLSFRSLDRSIFHFSISLFRRFVEGNL